jgi:hypothetical protein
MQSSSENPLLGVSGRAELLQRLGSSLLSLPAIFGPDGRPGNIVGKSFFPGPMENSTNLD